MGEWAGLTQVGALRDAEVTLAPEGADRSLGVGALGVRALRQGSLPVGVRRGGNPWEGLIRTGSLRTGPPRGQVGQPGAGLVLHHEVQEARLAEGQGPAGRRQEQEETR